MCLFCDCFLNILLQLLYHVFQKLIQVFVELVWTYRLIFKFISLGECTELFKKTGGMQMYQVVKLEKETGEK